MEKLRLLKHAGENTWDLIDIPDSGGPYIGPGGEVLKCRGVGGRGDEWSLEEGSKGNWYILDYDSGELSQITEEEAKGSLNTADENFTIEMMHVGVVPRGLTPPILPRECNYSDDCKATAEFNVTSSDGKKIIGFTPMCAKHAKELEGTRWAKYVEPRE